MGRIRTRMVKRTGHLLMGRHLEKFGSEFGKNKTAVSEVAEVRTKKLRNVIAGYITKKMKSADR